MAGTTSFPYFSQAGVIIVMNLLDGRRDGCSPPPPPPPPSDDVDQWRRFHTCTSFNRQLIQLKQNRLKRNDVSHTGN